MTGKGIGYKMHTREGTANGNCAQTWPACTNRPKCSKTKSAGSLPALFSILSTSQKDRPVSASPP